MSNTNLSLSNSSLDRM